MRNSLVLAVLMAFASGVHAQGRDSAIWGILDRLAESGAQPLTLEEIFADIGEVLVSADRSKANVLEARIAETDEEIRHLENLQSASRRGIVVDLPEVLRERAPVSADKVALEREHQQVDELRARIRVMEERKKRLGAERRTDEIVQAPRASTRGEAALEVVLSVPEPTVLGPADEAEIKEAVDQAAYGRALFLAGDYRGAARTYEGLPRDQRTLEIRYQMARCQDLLGRWEAAEQLYTAVSTDDREGHWGNLAKWMLDLGRKKQGIRELILSSKGKGNE